MPSRNKKSIEEIYPHIKTIRYLTKEINDKNKVTVGRTTFVDPIHVELLKLAEALDGYKLKISSDSLMNDGVDR